MGHGHGCDGLEDAGKALTMGMFWLRLLATQDSRVKFLKRTCMGCESNRPASYHACDLPPQVPATCPSPRCWTAGSSRARTHSNRCGDPVGDEMHPLAATWVLKEPWHFQLLCLSLHLPANLSLPSSLLHCHHLCRSLSILPQVFAAAKVDTELAKKGQLVGSCGSGLTACVLALAGGALWGCWWGPLAGYWGPMNSRRLCVSDCMQPPVHAFRVT